MYTCDKCEKTFKKEPLYQKHLASKCGKKGSSLKKSENSKIIVEKIIDSKNEEDIKNLVVKNDEHFKIETEKIENNDLDLSNEIPKSQINNYEIKNIVVDNKIKNDIYGSENTKKPSSNYPKNNIDKFQLILDKLYSFEDIIKNISNKVDNLEKQFNSLNQSSNKQSNIQITPIKKERWKVNIDYKSYLRERSIDKDVELLYKIYIENMAKENLPIKKLKKNDVTFWDGANWVIDNNSVLLKDIFSANLKKIYSFVNTLNETKENNTEYLNQQEYIHGLKNKKYQQQMIQLFLEKYCSF